MIRKIDVRQLGGMLIGLAAGAVGCAPVQPTTGGLAVSAHRDAGPVAVGTRTVASQRFQLQLRNVDRPRRLMALPVSWDQANVTFNSPTALTAPSVVQIPNASFMPFGGGTSYVFTGDQLSTPPIPVLRPATDYTITADLETASPLTLEAYGVMPGSQTIEAGPNDFTITLSPTGNQGTEIAVATPAGVQGSPAVAYDGTNDQWLACWVDGGKVMARRFDATGAALGAADVAISTTTSAATPVVAYNATAASYMVAWSDTRNGHADVYFRTVSTSDVLGPETALDHTGGHTAAETNPTIASSTGANRFMICWEDNRNNATSGVDLYAYRLDSLGALSSEIAVAVSPGATDQTKPKAIFCDGLDRFLVGFEDGGDLRYQRINALTGATLDGATGAVLTSASGVQDQLSMAINELDGYVFMTWRDARTAPTQIYYAILDASTGNFLQPDTALTSGVAAAGYPLAGFCTAHGDYTVLFADNRSASQLDLFLDRIKRDGVTAYGEKSISTAAGDQRPAGMLYSTTSDQFLAVWEDDRNGGANTDVYAQRLR